MLANRRRNKKKLPLLIFLIKETRLPTEEEKTTAAVDIP
jgi:hypothetical protein